MVAGGAAAGLVKFGRKADPPDPTTPAPAIQTRSGTFNSAARLGKPTTWVASWPAGHQVGDELPLLIVLHGFGGDHRAAFDGVGLDRAAADVIAAGAPPFIIAAVDGGNGYYHRRKEFGDSGAMVTDELVPLLAGLGARAKPYGLLGWSMGGYGALLLAQRHGPEVISTIVAESPALWTSVEKRNPEAFDSAEDYLKHDVWAGRDRLADTAVRIDCGTEDAFYPATKKYVEGLNPRPAGEFNQGGHDGDYWRAMAPAQLRFAAEHLG